MPTLTAERHPIIPATYGPSALDPAEVSEGKVTRARRALARAKAIIEEKGWTQHQSLSPSGERCLTQAISEARQVRSKPGLMPLTSVTMTHILVGLLESARPKVTRRAPAFSYIGDVADWNDKSGRTQEQVIALLDAAIEQ